MQMSLVTSGPKSKHESGFGRLVLHSLAPFPVIWVKKAARWPGSFLEIRNPRLDRPQNPSRSVILWVSYAKRVLYQTDHPDIWQTRTYAALNNRPCYVYGIHDDQRQITKFGHSIDLSRRLKAMRKKFGQHLEVKGRWQFATTSASCLAETEVHDLLHDYRDPDRMPEWFLVVPGDE